MNCPDKEALSAYLDGETGGSESAALAGHLEGCGLCRARLKTLRAVKAAVSAAVQAPPMPADLRRALQDMIPRPAPWWRRLLGEGAGPLRPAAAVSFCLAAALALVWAARHRPGRSSRDELPVEMLLAAHSQYELTMPLAPEERIVADLAAQLDEETAGGANGPY